MLNEQFINPQSIAIVGASSNPAKPGGKLTQNLLDGRFRGSLFLVNPKSPEIQGRKTYASSSQIGQTVDLAFIALPAAICLQEVRTLFESCGTRSFVIVSAGFSETSAEGKQLEDALRKFASDHDCQIIGPNCTGLVTRFHSGAFTTPIPEYHEQGATLVSASGATAVFLMEQGMANGLKFNQVFSTGNGMMIHLEDILEYLDLSEMPKKSVVLLYIEAIKNPEKFYKHAYSLTQKGHKLAAIKAGVSKKGSLAAASHTGALANSDSLVNALMRKCGIIRCANRTELIAVGQVLSHKPLKGNNIAIVTHAGGPGVMATDVLEQQGFNLPELDQKSGEELLAKLHPGSSVKNPFDILATGSEKELSATLDTIVTSELYHGIVVIFGSPGLFDEQGVFELLSKYTDKLGLPVYVVGPSVVNTIKELELYKQLGKQYFPDESLLSAALGKVLEQKGIPTGDYQLLDATEVSSEFLQVGEVFELLNESGFQTAKYAFVESLEEAKNFLKEVNAMIVMKATDILHKTEDKAVYTGIESENDLELAFSNLRKVTKAPLLIQQQQQGHEVYVGVNYDPLFGHQLFIGNGGIYLESRKDIQSGLLPVNFEEAHWLINQVRESAVWAGARGQEGIDMNELANVMVKLSNLVIAHPEIKELDCNPIIALGKELVVVDARVR